MQSMPQTGRGIDREMCLLLILEQIADLGEELLLGGDDLRLMVNEICRKAPVFNPNIHADDVTVIGVKVTA